MDCKILARNCMEIRHHSIDAREERIKELREAYLEGCLTVDSSRLATALMEFEQNWDALTMPAKKVNAIKPITIKQRINLSANAAAIS